MTLVAETSAIVNSGDGGIDACGVRAAGVESKLMKERLSPSRDYVHAVHFLHVPIHDMHKTESGLPPPPNLFPFFFSLFSKFATPPNDRLVYDHCT